MIWIWFISTSDNAGCMRILRELQTGQDHGSGKMGRTARKMAKAPKLLFIAEKPGALHREGNSEAMAAVGSLSGKPRPVPPSIR
jgi:hypothetical protein